MGDSSWHVRCFVGSVKDIAVDLETKVARCRLILSAVAIVAVYVDPTEPTLLPWLNLVGGGFTIDWRALTVMGAHFGYSAAVYVTLTRTMRRRGRLVDVTTWVDVLFGTVITVFTEGTSSPFWAFFVFAVVAAGVHGGLRRSLAVTTVSVTLYLTIILASLAGDTNVYIMRPVYLAIVGYLSAYLGEQRLGLQAQVHRLEAVEERSRIARALHDGCVQTLGGVNLMLEGCRELLATGRTVETLAVLSRLQRSINREHDDLRTYVRELADKDTSREARDAPEAWRDTRFRVTADFDGPATFVEQVLQIVREGITNVRRHAQADAATIAIRTVGDQVHIAIDDDGVGFRDDGQLPWSMSSRAAEAGGEMRVLRDGSPGAHVRLTLPEA
jgi:signal transduction histidine kinase